MAVHDIYLWGPAGQQQGFELDAEMRPAFAACARAWGLLIYTITVGAAGQAEAAFDLTTCPRGWTFAQEWQQRGRPHGLYFRLLPVC